MPSSMTGFGRGQAEAGGREVTAEIRSVNHRFLDIRSALPPELVRHGHEIERRLRERFARGRIEVQVGITRTPALSAPPSIDHRLARAYLERYRALAAALDLDLQVDLQLLLQAPGVVTVPEPEDAAESVGEALLIAVDLAIDEVDRMRRTEGAHLASALVEHVQRVRALVRSILDRAPRAIEHKKRRLEGRLAELTEGVGVDPARLAQEVALLVDRLDLSEELERLEAHVEHSGQMLRSEAPVGRKLDFLVQEMHRESNTVGAKCSDALIAHAVVELKSEIERMREQIQNLE